MLDHTPLAETPRPAGLGPRAPPRRARAPVPRALVAAALQRRVGEEAQAVERPLLRQVRVIGRGVRGQHAVLLRKLHACAPGPPALAQAPRGRSA